MSYRRKSTIKKNQFNYEDYNQVTENLTLVWSLNLFLSQLLIINEEILTTNIKLNKNKKYLYNEEVLRHILLEENKTRPRNNKLAENTDDSFLSNFVYCQISEIIEFTQLECIVTNYLIFLFFLSLSSLHAAQVLPQVFFDNETYHIHRFAMLLF